MLKKRTALISGASALAMAIGLAGVQTADAQQRKSLRWTTSQVGTYGYAVAAAMAKVAEQALGGEYTVTVQPYANPTVAMKAVMNGEGEIAYTADVGTTQFLERVGGFKDEVASPGFNGFALRGSKGWHYASVSAKTTGKTYRLACTQDHNNIDDQMSPRIQGRLGEIIREATVFEFQKEPDFAKHKVHRPPLVSLWEEHGYDGNKWGLAVDLNSCTGRPALMSAKRRASTLIIVPL